MFYLLLILSNKQLIDLKVDITWNEATAGETQPKVKCN